MNMNHRPSCSVLKRSASAGRLLALLFATGLFFGPHLQADDYTWTLAGTGTWSGTTNWSPNTPAGGPTAADNITVLTGITGSPSTDIGGGTVNVGNITRSGTGATWVIGGGGATLSTLNAASLSLSVVANVFVRNDSAAGLVFTATNVNVSAGSLFFGTTSNAPNNQLIGLTVSGTTAVSGGALLVNVQNGSSNTYSLGVLDVSGAGVVTLANRPASGSDPGNANITGLAGSGGFIQADTGHASNSNSNQDATLIVTNTANFSSNTVLRNSAIATNAGVLSLTKSGAGTQTLTGASTYTGSTSISEGVLQLGANGATGSIVSNVITSGTGALAFNRSNAYTFSNTISGSGQVFQVGSGTTTLSAENSYSGGTTITAGGLIVTSDANLGDAAGEVTFDGGALLMTTSGTMSSDRDTVINAGGAKFYNATNSLNTWGGDISGVGSLTKQGTNQASSVLYLTGSNTYQGGTVIQSGVLRIDSDQNLGDAAGTVTFNNGGNTGRLETSQSMTSNRDFILNGTTAGFATTGTGNVTVLNGDISGAGVLEKRFVGTLHLTGSNSYASTSITGGVVRVDADQNLGLGAVTFANTTSASALETTQTFTSNRSMVLNNTASTATVTTSGSANVTTWSGQITGSGAGGFQKNGEGTLVLSASNSYSAGTLVAAGTLLLTNASAAGTGGIAITGGAGTSLHVDVDNGTGTIANAVTFTSADNGGTYVLERANGTSFAGYSAGSAISGGVDTSASLLAGTASADRTLTTSLSLTASVVATNAGITRSNIFSLDGTATDIFVLQLQIANVEADQYLGWLDGSNTWVNAIDGNSTLGGSAVQGYAGSYAASGASATSDYLGSWGYDTTNDTVWAVLDHNSEFAVIPEPSTWAMLAAGLSVMMIAGRKRRRLATGQKSR